MARSSNPGNNIFLFFFVFLFFFGFFFLCFAVILPYFRKHFAKTICLLSYLGHFYPIWDNYVPSRTILSHLRLFCPIWDHLVPYGNNKSANLSVRCPSYCQKLLNQS